MSELNEMCKGLDRIEDAIDDVLDSLHQDDVNAKSKEYSVINLDKLRGEWDKLGLDPHEFDYYLEKNGRHWVEERMVDTYSVNRYEELFEKE